MPTQSGALRCKYCNDTFQRNGHLQRHLLRHSGLKPFICRVCTKPFSRNDTLIRHEAIHGQHDSQQKNNRRSVRACVPCVQAKQRCYGGDPCARCERRRSICEYSREQRQSPSPISSVSQPSRIPLSGGLSGDLAEQDATVSPPPFPTVPVSASTSIESNPQTLVTLPPTHSSVTTSVGDSLAEGANRMSWPGPFPTPDLISTDESDIFAGYLPHDMRYAEETSGSFGFPFVWMSQSFESPAQPPYAMGQGISNLYIPSEGNLVHWEAAGCADLTGPGPETRTDVDSGAARTRGNLNATHTSPADVCPSFPTLQEEELQIAGAELFGYVSKISGKAYTALRSFYFSERGYDDMSFPDCRLLRTFVELYFEYFDPHLPFLHPTRVETDDLSWILLTAIAAIGSQYSEIRDASRFTAVLQYLLRKATHPQDLHRVANRSDMSLVQSVLLRDVGLIFSGSVSDQTVLQQEKSWLMTLCRGLKTSTGFCDVDETTVDQGLDQVWLAWLQGEEAVRLVHCVHVMECFQLVFFDLRPLFRLTDFTQRLPCDGNAWRCRSARHWNEEKQKASPDSRTKRSGSFSTRSNVLSLYADERATLDHMQSSRRLKSLIRSGSCLGPQEQDTYSARRNPLSYEASKEDITFLDAVIDDVIVSESFLDSGIERRGQDPIVHVIAILREIPLRMIYASVGWQASGAEMQRSRERLKGYLQRNQSTARTCLWHAAQIYSSSRSLRYPAYYSSLSFAIAVSYILLYAQIVQSPARQGDLLRLDKVIEKPDFDTRTGSAHDFRAHITGIGMLDSAESGHRLLVDAEKALRSHRPWRSMAQALAFCFSQMSKGQRPNIGQN